LRRLEDEAVGACLDLLKTSPALIGRWE